jgi:hypothetical protein
MMPARVCSLMLILVSPTVLALIMVDLAGEHYSQIIAHSMVLYLCKLIPGSTYGLSDKLLCTFVAQIQHRPQPCEVLFIPHHITYFIFMTYFLQNFFAHNTCVYGMFPDMPTIPS